MLRKKSKLDPQFYMHSSGIVNSELIITCPFSRLKFLEPQVESSTPRKHICVHAYLFSYCYKLFCTGCLLVSTHRFPSCATCFRVGQESLAPPDFSTSSLMDWTWGSWQPARLTTSTSISAFTRWFSSPSLILDCLIYLSVGLLPPQQ
jgi:hypothetical protein